ncbi:DUF1194 domain-containing protein [Anaplasma marginale]|uniref:DUF1194 domain-containing protein n=1 Tax=Anaplasma marginale TaxID=770 RepID=UPI0001B4652A|nr:DUF1194 domain-containing protein [Anaplasma marginale]RCL19610.1 DUF1194 domain-containing protein [Anaplasma marginale]
MISCRRSSAPIRTKSLQGEQQQQTNTLAGRTAEVQAGLEAAGIKLDDAHTTPEAKGVDSIDQKELEQAAEGLATAVNEASVDGKIQSLNQQESQIAQVRWQKTTSNNNRIKAM